MRSDLAGELNTQVLLVLTCVPKSTYKTQLDTLTGNGVDLKAAIGELVQYDFLANYQVIRCVNDGTPDGRIVGIEGNTNSGYVLTIQDFKNLAVVRLPFSGTIALGNAVQAASAAAQAVDVFTGYSAGLGQVIAKDSDETGFVDVLIPGNLYASQIS